MESVYRSVVMRRQLGDEVAYEKRTFGATGAEIQHLERWLRARGRKSDFRDARRLADRWSAGDLEESFIPGAEQRSWRWLSRTRV
jgi:hypothetical protein